jgi:hypothetical protein
MVVYMLSDMRPAQNITSCLFQINFNALLPSKSKSSIDLRFPNKYVYTLLFYFCYMRCLCDILWFDDSNNIYRGVQIVKLLIMYFSPALYSNIPLWSKHSFPHLFPNTFRLQYGLPLTWESTYHILANCWKKYNFVKMIPSGLKRLGSERMCLRN